MQIDPEDLKKWGGDFISNLINKHVASMPDRPRVVVAIIIWGREADGLHAEVLRPFSPNHFSTEALKALGSPFRVAYLGFDSTDSEQLFRFLLEAAKLKIDEVVFYLDGKPVFRSDRVTEVPYKVGESDDEEPNA
jgi:hypothetical protein